MKLFVFVLCLVFFVSCSSREFKITNEKVVLSIKSKKIKYNDIALVERTPHLLELHGFFAGTSLFHLKISKNICINKTCLTPKLFNREFLSKKYEDDMLKNILYSKAIFGSKNLQKNKNGFTQNIKNNHYDIRYVVSNRSVYFKDKLNRILIKLKRLEQ